MAMEAKGARAQGTRAEAWTADRYIYRRRAMAMTGWENGRRDTAWRVFAVWEGKSARVGSEHITRTRSPTIALRVRVATL